MVFEGHTGTWPVWDLWQRYGCDKALIFEIGSYVAQAGLEPYVAEGDLEPLPQPECLDCRQHYVTISFFLHQGLSV